MQVQETAPSVQAYTAQYRLFYNNRTLQIRQIFIVLSKTVDLAYG